MTVGDVSQTEMNSPFVVKEGKPDRISLGLDRDSSMLDAREVEHKFRVSRHGDWCRVCGLNNKAKVHA